MKLSIVIPVFNAEKYLRKCFDSILAAMDDITGEVIVLDDHSTDGSLTIIEKYVKKYPKVFSLVKHHVSGAAALRNFGAKKAKGEYLWFMDADDYIAKDAIKQLIKQADKTEADMVMMGAERVYPNGYKDYLSPVSPEEKNYKSRFVRYGMGPWQVIVRRKWWVEHKFGFGEGLIHEDMGLMSALILYTDRFACVDKPLYFYSQNDDSVLHRKKFSPHIFDIFPVLEGLYQKFKDAGAEKEYHDELEWFFIWNLLIDAAKDFSKFPEGKPGFKRTREMLSEYFPEWRKNRFLKEKPLKLRIRVRLNYLK